MTILFCSLRGKPRFHWVIERKLEWDKKKWRLREGEGRRGDAWPQTPLTGVSFSPLPSPPPFIYLFCSRFSFRTVTRAEKLVTRRQATNLSVLALRNLIPVYNWRWSWKGSQSGDHEHQVRRVYQPDKIKHHFRRSSVKELNITWSKLLSIWFHFSLLYLKRSELK